jgi:hypothetical protein
MLSRRLKDQWRRASLLLRDNREVLKNILWRVPYEFVLSRGILGKVLY